MLPKIWTHATIRSSPAVTRLRHWIDADKVGRILRLRKGYQRDGGHAAAMLQGLIYIISIRDIYT